MVSEKDLRLCLSKSIKLRKMWGKFVQMDPGKWNQTKRFLDAEKKIMREIRTVLKNTRGVRNV